MDGSRLTFRPKQMRKGMDCKHVLLTKNDLSLVTPFSNPVSAYVVQVIIAANHMSGKDTHVRGLRVLGPIEFVDI